MDKERLIFGSIIFGIFVVANLVGFFIEKTDLINIFDRYDDFEGDCNEDI